MDKRFKDFPELEQIERDDPKLFQQLVDTIDRGILYIDDDNNPFHPVATEYRKIRNKIEKRVADYLKKQNARLAEIDPFLKYNPIQVTIAPHPYDDPNPPKKHRPSYFQNYLIKELSDLLKGHFHRVPERSELISNLFNSFFSIHIDPRSVRKHF